MLATLRVGRHVLAAANRPMRPPRPGGCPTWYASPLGRHGCCPVCVCVPFVYHTRTPGPVVLQPLKTPRTPPPATPPPSAGDTAPADDICARWTTGASSTGITTRAPRAVRDGQGQRCDFPACLPGAQVPRDIYICVTHLLASSNVLFPPTAASGSWGSTGRRRVVPRVGAICITTGPRGMPVRFLSVAVCVCAAAGRLVV